jgi:hypothetical protein
MSLVVNDRQMSAFIGDFHNRIDFSGCESFPGVEIRVFQFIEKRPAFILPYTINEIILESQIENGPNFCNPSYIVFQLSNLRKCLEFSYGFFLYLPNPFPGNTQHLTGFF